jgi:predicted dehydrogenase
MSTARKIRCGVVGTGHLGQHHARIYASLPQAELTGILEANDARAAEICSKYGCRRFATLDDLASACEAVSVAVPTDRHAEVALPLLRHGCHAPPAPSSRSATSSTSTPSSPGSTRRSTNRA